MVDESVVTTISREPPDIEAYKLGLLELAKQRADIPVDMSQMAYKTAGLSDLQRLAMRRATEGLGSYQPYLNQGAGALGAGISTAGNVAGLGAEAAGLFRGAPGFGYGAAALANQFGGAAPGLASQRAALANQFGGGAAALANQLGGGAAALANQRALGAMGGTNMYDPNEAAAFMDPYQREVTQQALKDIDRQAQQDLMGIRAQGVGAGGLGGSRQAVAEQEFQRNISDIKARRIAEDYSRNYQQALGASMQGREAQQQRLMQAQQLGAPTALGGGQLGAQTALGGGQLGAQTALGGGQLGLSGLQQGAQTALGGGQLGLAGLQQGAGGLMGIGSLYGQTANILGGLGEAYGTMGARQGALQQGENQFLGLLGGLDQETQQRALDAYRQTATAEAYEPFQRIGFLSDMYKGAPTGESAITATTAPGASPMNAALGTGISALAAYQGYQNLFNNPQ